MIDLDLMAETLKTIHTLKVDNINPLEVIASEVETLAQMQNDLDQLIDTLQNQKDRLIMRLRYLKGLTVLEIVGSTNQSRSDIYNHLRAAVKWLVQHYPDRIMPPHFLQTADNNSTDSENNSYPCR